MPLPAWAAGDQKERPKDIKTLGVSILSVVLSVLVFIWSQRGEEDKSGFAVGFAVVSALLLVLNKIVLTYVPSPVLMVGTQLLSTWAVTYLPAIYKDAGEFDWTVTRVFWPVPVAFLFLLLGTATVLSHLSIEVVILLRSFGTIPVCIIEYFFLNTNFPGTQSILVMTSIIALAIAYVYAGRDHIVWHSSDKLACIQW